MEKDDNLIERIEFLTADYLEKGDYESALRNYHVLIDLYPDEEVYHSNYINLLVDPDVVSELAMSAYEQAIDCCDHAIDRVYETDKEIFYMKKAYIYLLMIEKDVGWDIANRHLVIAFVESARQIYPSNSSLLKCAATLYRISRDLTSYKIALDLLIQLDPSDVMLILEKASSLEGWGEKHEAISVLENWISINDRNPNLCTAYVKIISLYKAVNNLGMAEKYQVKLHQEL